MQELLSALHEVHIAPMWLVTNGLQYAGKRDAVLASLRARNMPTADKEKIRWFLGEIHKHSDLRNRISHAIWVRGTRKNSIKPYQMKTRGGTLQYFGHLPSERDYTSPELKKIAHELSATLDRFSSYLEGAGYPPFLNRSEQVDRLYSGRRASPQQGSPSVSG